MARYPIFELAVRRFGVLASDVKQLVRKVTTKPNPTAAGQSRDESTSGV